MFLVAVATSKPLKQYSYLLWMEDQIVGSRERPTLSGGKGGEGVDKNRPKAFTWRSARHTCVICSKKHTWGQRRTNKRLWARCYIRFAASASQCKVSSPIRWTTKFISWLCAHCCSKAKLTTNNLSILQIPFFAKSLPRAADVHFHATSVSVGTIDNSN